MNFARFNTLYITLQRAESAPVSGPKVAMIHRHNNRTGLDSQKGSAPPLECDLDLGHSGKFLRTGKVDQTDESWGHQGQGHTLKQPISSY